MRWVIPGVTLAVIGFQTVLASFFLSVLAHAPAVIPHEAPPRGPRRADGGCACSRRRWPRSFPAARGSSTSAAATDASPRASWPCAPTCVIEGAEVKPRPGTAIPVTAVRRAHAPLRRTARSTPSLAVDTLHHADDPEALLRECARVAPHVVLKDHLRDPWLARPTLRFMDWVGNRRHGVSVPDDYWPRRRWEDAFARVGLEVESLRDLVALSRRRSPGSSTAACISRPRCGAAILSPGPRPVSIARCPWPRPAACWRSRPRRSATSSPAWARSSTAAVDILFACTGRVVVTGMGKSGLIGQKISATLSSTGTPSLYLHPADAIHGDLGRIVKGDAVLAISYSGETEEIVALTPTVRRLGSPLLAITGAPGSTLATAADVHLDASIREEACPLGLAPTASTTAALALGDALAMALLERRGFTVDDFAVLHPGGRLGRKLLRVEDVMHTGDDVPRVSPGDVDEGRALRDDAQAAGHDHGGGRGRDAAWG